MQVNLTLHQFFELNGVKPELAPIVGKKNAYFCRKK